MANGTGLKKSTQQQEVQAVLNRLSHLNEITSRFLLARKITEGHIRDIDNECGYPTDVSTQDYYDMYRRGDVARRVVTVFPEYCWKEIPEVYEVEEQKYTLFEQAWQKLVLNQSLNLMSALMNADRLSGIGRFGVLFLGFAGGGDFRTPVTSSKELLYLQAFDERNVSISKFEDNATNSRFAQPVMYKIKMANGSGGQGDKEVHYSRVIHIAEGAVENPVYGTPRLESVFNRFLDIKKVLGGSAEMFWKGGFPGTVFDMDPEAEPTDASLLDMKEQIHRYEESLSRTLNLQGVKAQQLTVQVASPTEHLEAQFKAISATTGIPMRVLFGSEQAQLASTQDRKNWYDRVQSRRKNFCIPNILHPFVQRLIDVSILPKPTEPFRVHWPSDNMLDDKERADLGRVRTESIARYADSPMAETVVPVEQFLIRILGFTIEEAESIMKDIKVKVQDDSAIEEDDDALEPSKKGY